MVDLTNDPDAWWNATAVVVVVVLCAILFLMLLGEVIHFFWNRRTRKYPTVWLIRWGTEDLRSGVDTWVNVPKDVAVDYTKRWHPGCRIVSIGKYD